ncbi:MAG TPA: thiamine-phosphate kinase [Saprospiraceae bacterium]|nr:thiamine-phosphate kinase [Saprospiraceae bacterium]
MKEESKGTEIGELGEFGLIEHLTKNFKIKNPSTIKGVGDDAAVMDYGGLETVVSTDLLLEGIHFDLMYTPLKHLGYKAVVVNVSDIYAMNAKPTQITVSLGISNRFSVEALEAFYAGVKLACDYYGVDLVGGDTSSSRQGMVISVTALGVAPKDKIVYRSTAKEGDLICVTGYLGNAYLGLQILEREKQIFQEHPEIQPELNKEEAFIGRFLKPEARKDVIELFAQANLVPTSMIDVSDGLASDLFHICKASGVGAYLEESGVPIHMDTQLKIIEEFKLDPITVALHGGEDYELLFTVDPKDLEKVKVLPNLFIAGEITSKEDGIKLHTKGGNIHALKAQGWQHF